MRYGDASRLKVTFSEPVRVAAVIVTGVHVMVWMRVSHFVPVVQGALGRAAAHIFTIENEYYYGGYPFVDGPLRWTPR